MAVLLLVIHLSEELLLFSLYKLRGIAISIGDRIEHNKE